MAAATRQDTGVPRPEGAARSPGAHEVLRTALRQVDRARARLRTRPNEAHAAWHALVAGRWTLIECFEADGKRFLLARKNGPAAPGLPALSERERQALALAGLGYSNKHIGYVLGLSTSTVGGYLSRAARKLGATSRIELVRVARALAPRPEAP